MKWIRLASLLLTLLTAAGGCSVQMAYNNLDRLARWSVSDLVDMNDTQRAFFDARFEHLWVWHRREHLPAYADFLDGVALTIGDEMSEARMQSMVDRVIGWAEEVESEAMPMAAELLASLSDEQVRELARAFEESNTELAEPELDVSDERAREQWADDFEDRFTRFSGRLTSVQRAYIDEKSGAYRPELVRWAEYRRRWQQAFFELLAERDDVAALEAGLRRLSQQRERYHGDELAAIDAHNTALLREMSVWLLNSLTEQQRERFVDRLTELADDFRELAADAPPRGSLGEPPCLVRC